MVRRVGVGLVGLAACVLVAMGIVATWLQPSIAFADVKGQVNATKSVRYYETRFHDGKDAGEVHAQAILTELDARIAKIDEAMKDAKDEEKESLLKEQAKLKERLAQLKIKLQLKGNEPWKRKVMILGRHLQRVESTDAHGEHVSITNAKSGKAISINHSNRSVLLLTKQITIDSKGNRTERPVTGDASIDFYGKISEIPDNASKIEETIVIDEKELVGFRAVERDGSATWTHTFWVDPKTKLPRQIDINWRNNRGSVDWRLSKIEFDVPLDKSLFSTEPPEGYDVRESGILGLKPDN